MYHLSLSVFMPKRHLVAPKTTWMFQIRKLPNGQNIVLLLQVPNRTLGSKSYSIPWQTLFASPSSYSILIKGCLQCRRLWLVAYTSFQLTHMTHDDYTVWASKGNQETRKLLQCSQLCHQGYAPVHDGHHGSIVRIFVALHSVSGGSVYSQWPICGCVFWAKRPLLSQQNYSAVSKVSYKLQVNPFHWHNIL